MNDRNIHAPQCFGKGNYKRRASVKAVIEYWTLRCSIWGFTDRRNTVWEAIYMVLSRITKHIWFICKFWGCASKSGQAILQKAQSKILRVITNAPWYVSNLTLHEDLKISYVREVIFEKYAKHHRKLETHPNPLLHPLLDIGQPRRLKRTQIVDLLWGSRGSVIGRGLIMSLEDCNALLLSAH